MGGFYEYSLFVFLKSASKGELSNSYNILLKNEIIKLTAERIGQPNFTGIILLTARE